MSNTGTAPAYGVNDTRYDDYVNVLTTLAEAQGKGENARMQALLATCEAAFNGLLDTRKHKHGQGIDDAYHHAAMYVELRDNTVKFMKGDNSHRKLRCYFRLMIKLGSCQQWGADQPIRHVRRLVQIWMTLRADKRNVGKLRDATEVMVSYARRQLNSDDLLGEQEKKEMCFLHMRNKATVEDVLVNISKTMYALWTGKHDAGRARTPEVEEILGQLKLLRDKFAKARDEGIELEGVET